MNQAKATMIFSLFAMQNPHPRTELIYHNPFELLIAVILSAQATDLSVNKATNLLFTLAPTPQAMLRLGEEGLKEYIKTIGLYNSKARHIIQTAEILCRDYGGEVPNTRQALEALPGVGRKTANVLLNTLFGQPTIAVDTHIFRVAKRIGFSSGKTPLEVEKDLLKITPAEFLSRAHHWLVLHGRYVCIARKPKCSSCLIRDLCEFEDKN